MQTEAIKLNDEYFTTYNGDPDKGQSSEKKLKEFFFFENSDLDGHRLDSPPDQFHQYQ